MVVTRADVPARLRVDPHSLSARSGEIEAALGQALERAIANVGTQLEQAGAAGRDLAARVPEFVWTGPGVGEVPMEARRWFEERIAAVVLAAAPAGTGLAAVPVVPASGGTAAKPPSAPPDARLAGAIEWIKAIAREFPQPLAARAEVLERLEAVAEKFDASDPARYTAIAREVQLRFPPEILIAFLALLEHRFSGRSRELRGPTGMRAPGLLLPHLLLLPGSTSIDTERLGNALASVEGFLGGVLEGFKEKVTAEQLERLAERAGWSAAFSTFFPPVFVLGAAEGIARDVWGSVTGAVELVTNLPAIIHAVDQVLDIVFSSEGREIGRMLGLEIGRALAGDVHKLLDQNFVAFTYNLGKLVGPSIVYAVAAILGLPHAAASALAVRLAPILKQLATRFPRLAALLARAGKLGGLPLGDIDAPHVPRPPGPGAGLEQSVQRQLAKHHPDEAPLPPAVAQEVLPEASPPPEGLTRPNVTGGKRPKIDGHSVPSRPKGEAAPVILDIEDIDLRPGEKVRDAVKRVQKVIKQPISGIKPVKDAWDAAAKHVLDGRPLSSVTRQEMLGKPPFKSSLYDRVRDRFWQHEVPDSPAAKAAFADAGFDVSEPKAPMLITNGQRPVSDLDRRVSLDHSAEKALADNWKKGIDPDNLVFEFQRPNSWREIVQVRHHMRDDPFAGMTEWRIGDPWPGPNQ